MSNNFKVTYHYSPELTTHIRAIVAEAVREERKRIVEAMKSEGERLVFLAGDSSSEALVRLFRCELAEAVYNIGIALERLP